MISTWLQIFINNDANISKKNMDNPLSWLLLDCILKQPEDGLYPLEWKEFETQKQWVTDFDVLEMLK